MHKKMEHQQRHHETAQPRAHPRLIGAATENVGYLLLGTCLIAFVIGCILLFLPSRSDSWPTVPAKIIDIRVLPEILGVEGGRQSIVYKAEVLLQYSVDGKSYAFWADAPAVDRDPEWLRTYLRSLRYSIRYNPKHPEQAKRR